MKGRTSILSFLLVEGLLLLAVVVPVAHVRSFTERVVLSGALPELAPAEGLYVLLRSLLMAIGPNPDVLNYLLAIANRLDIDVEEAFRRKNAANQRRSWT